LIRICHITGSFHEDLCIFMIVSRPVLLINIIKAKVVEKIKTRILCLVTSPPPDNRTVYEIMCKNVVEGGGGR